MDFGGLAVCCRQLVRRVAGDGHEPLSDHVEQYARAFALRVRPLPEPGDAPARSLAPGWFADALSRFSAEQELEVRVGAELGRTMRLTAPLARPAPSVLALLPRWPVAQQGCVC